MVFELIFSRFLFFFFPRVVGLWSKGIEMYVRAHVHELSDITSWPILERGQKLKYLFNGQNKYIHHWQPYDVDADKRAPVLEGQGNLGSA